MKKLLMLFVILTTAHVFAATSTARPVSLAQARQNVRRSATYKDIQKLQEEAKTDPAKRAEITARIERNINTSLRDVMTLDATQQSALNKMGLVDPVETMAQVASLAAIIKHPSSSQTQKEKATLTLRLMAAGSVEITGVYVKSDDEAKQQDAVTRVFAISHKMANLNFGEASSNFINRYLLALREGNTIEQAVKKAANDKFTEEQLRDCI